MHLSKAIEGAENMIAKKSMLRMHGDICLRGINDWYKNESSVVIRFLYLPRI